MRLLSSSAVNVLGLLRQVHDDRTISPSDLSSFVVGLAKAANNPRKLWEYESEYGGEGDDEDFFDDWGDASGVLGDAFGDADMFPPELAECGIDVPGMMGTLLDTDITDNFDPEGLSPDFLELFADDGEVDCTKEQEAQFMDAVASFTSCTGWDKFLEDKDALDKLADRLEYECGDFIPSSPLDMAAAQVDLDDMEGCLDVVLGDNPLGDFLRDLYLNPGKNCDCVAAFEEAVPSCLIHSLDDEVVVPGSLFKKASCLVGKACDAVEDICLDELGGLNECLPPLGGSKSCYKIELDCALEGSMSLTLPPRLTMGKLPDTCLAVNGEDPAGEHVPERLSAAYHKCSVADEEDIDEGLNIDKDWGVGEGEEEEEEEEESSSSIEEQAESEEAVVAYQTQQQAEYVPPAIDEVEESESMEKTEEVAAARTPLAIALAAAVGSIAVAFVATMMLRTRGRDDSDPSDNDFTQMPVIHSEGLEDNLVVPGVAHA